MLFSRSTTKNLCRCSQCHSHRRSFIACPWFRSWQQDINDMTSSLTLDTSTVCRQPFTALQHPSEPWMMESITVDGKQVQVCEVAPACCIICYEWGERHSTASNEERGGSEQDWCLKGSALHHPVGLIQSVQDLFLLLFRQEAWLRRTDVLKNNIVHNATQWAFLSSDEGVLHGITSCFRFRWEDSL